jgi:hypothetical protein
VSQFEITIIDRTTGRPAPAILMENLCAADVNDVENEWSGERIAAASRLHRMGLSVPEHWHWDWRKKSSKLTLLAYQCFGIKCENKMQGLMMTSTAKYSARLAPDTGKPLVYVEYVEAAPWNVAPLVDDPRYGGIGLRLIECAIRFSKAEGFNGRLGLHSLPQAAKFYREACGMTPLGCDPQMQDLPYFELTAIQAEQFLTEAPKS